MNNAALVMLRKSCLIFGALCLFTCSAAAASSPECASKRNATTCYKTCGQPARKTCQHGCYRCGMTFLPARETLPAFFAWLVD